MFGRWSSGLSGGFWKLTLSWGRLRASAEGRHAGPAQARDGGGYLAGPDPRRHLGQRLKLGKCLDCTQYAHGVTNGSRGRTGMAAIWERLLATGGCGLQYRAIRGETLQDVAANGWWESHTTQASLSGTGS